MKYSSSYKYVLFFCGFLCLAIGTVFAVDDPHQRMIIVKGDQAYPPYEFKNEKGEYNGFTVELVKVIMEELDMPYELELTDWRTVMREFDAGEIDLIPALIYTNDRARKYKFGAIHSWVYENAICRKGSPIKNISDLKDKKILIQVGDFACEYLSARGFSNQIELVESVKEALTKLSAGYGDVAICSNEVARNEIIVNSLDNLDLIDIGIPVQEYCFVGKDPLFLEQVDQVFYRLKQNGTYDAIYNKWFRRTNDDKYRKVLYWVFGVCWVGFSLLALFLSILRRKVRQARAEAVLSAERYVTVFNNTLVGLSYYDKNGILVDVNDAACRIFRVSDKQKLLDLKAPLCYDAVLAQACEIETLEDFSGILRYKLPELKELLGEPLLSDVEEVYIQTKIIHVRDAQGALSSIIRTSVDVTEKEQVTQKIIRLNREIRKYAEKLKYIISSSNIDIWDYDKKGDLFTITSSEETSKTFDSLPALLLHFPEEERVAFELILNQLSQGEISHFSIQRTWIEDLSLPDKVRYCIFSGVALLDEAGGITGCSGLIRDITDLIEVQKHLEEAKHKAERADKLKSAFLANMSHEIRTPLNAIIGFSDLLQSSDDVQERVTYMNVINQNNEILLRLIGDILDLSKIESGFIELKIEEFDWVQLFDEMGVALRQRFKNPQVEFRVENPYKKCMVELDKGRMQQVLTNFVTNAIKHTPSGYIRMGYLYQEDGLKVYVEDTGIGIPLEKQESVFERFEKLNDFAQGTGLGLSICKAIVEMQKGTIGVVSQEGVGSTFWAWIPCRIEFQE